MHPSRLGRHTVVRKIASGGMATVYLCRYEGEEGFRKKVAVKVIREDLSSDRRFRELFAREARLSASLSHPNLVQVFDFGREGDLYFLAMEYVEGWNLAQAILQRRQKGLGVPLGVFRHWILGILAAVGYLHGRGVVHRDISPSNVLLSRDGAVKVADFGIAAAARSLLAGGGGMAGKAGYLAPEVARGGSWTPASDLFAVAVIAAEMFLPGPLFERSFRKSAPDGVVAYRAGTRGLEAVPDAVRPVITKGLAADPSQRFDAAAEFAGAVQQAIPVPAGAQEIEEYWDALFPLAGEEETALDLHAPEEPGPAAVRERRAAYGGRKARITAASIAFLAAAGAGLYVVRDKAPAPPKPALPAGVPQSLSLPRENQADRPEVEPGRTGRGEKEALSGGSAPAAAGPTGPRQAASRPSGAAIGKKEEALAPPRAATGGGAVVSDAVPGGGLEGAGAVGRVPQPASQPSFAVVETDPPGAYVLLEDGTRMGKTPLALDARTWRGRKVTIEMAGYERKTFPADLLAEGTHLRLELERQVGTVEAIQAIPWAKVYDDGGRYLGETPLRSVMLPAGERRLRFVNEPLGVDRTETLVVRPGANPKMIVELTGRR